MTSRAELDRQFWRRSAGSASANPAAWAHTADCLRRAADELRSIWQQDLANLPKLLGTFEPLPVSIAFVIPLLLGLALENLAKGLIVANDPTQAVDTDPSSTKLLPELRKRHLSTRLLEEAGVNLS